MKIYVICTNLSLVILNVLKFDLLQLPSDNNHELF